jgi:DNA-binding LacI/PurR family transcriptional regulator
MMFRQAFVAAPTVSKDLNDRDDVAPDTRRRFQELSATPPTGRSTVSPATPA